MATATYILDVDWNNDGTYDGGDEAVTADLIEVTFTTGRQTADPLSGSAGAGVLTAVLRNDADKYNQFNGTSPLVDQLLPGRAVRLRTTAPSAKTLWEGILDSVIPEVKYPNRKRARLRALGPLSTLTDTKVSISMQTAVATGALITAVLDAAGFSATARDLDTGTVTPSRFWTDSKRNAIALIQELEQSEGGFVRESHDGDIVFEEQDVRQTDTRAATSQAVFTDEEIPASGELGYDRIEQQEPLAQVYNDLRATVQSYSVQSLAVLWTHPEATTAAGSPSIPAGESITVWANYPTPQSALEAVAVDAWTTPVENTDYEANTADDGTGSDISADASIVTTKFADACKLVITNNNASTMYLTLLQLRGTAVHADDPVTVQAEDATSQTAYGIRTFRRSEQARWVPTTAVAQTFLDERLLLYKDPQPVVRLSFNANKDSDHLDEAIAREVSDRITVGAQNVVGLGFEQDFFVEHISHRIILGTSHRVEYLLSSTANFDTFWSTLR